MEDNIKSKALIAMTKMEYYPVPVQKKDVSLTTYVKQPLAQLVSWGTAFDSIANVFNTVTRNKTGGSGLYKVTIDGAGKLTERVNGTGFIGGVKDGLTGRFSEQATLNPLMLDPATMFMAAALSSINKKLDNIIEAQKEIIEFLEQKEKAKLRGNLHFLNDIMDNYKHNWTSEKYKTNNHIKVLDIKQEAEQSILFYRDQINKRINKKNLFHIDKHVRDKLEVIQLEFKEYQLAMYLYAFSSFLDIMLLENFASAYLNSIVQKINVYSLDYRELYTKCYNQIEGDSKTSVQSHLLTGLAGTTKAAGKAASKIPLVNKSQTDDKLIEASNRLGEFKSKRTEKTMEQLIDVQVSAIAPFVENIKVINNLFNNDIEFLVDEENVYFALPVTSQLS